MDSMLSVNAAKISGDLFSTIGILVALYFIFTREQRRGFRRAETLFRAAMQLRTAGHTDLATQSLCSLAVLHPRFAANSGAEALLHEALENPAHRAALILAYKSMHDALPENAGLSYKLAHVYHLDGRNGDALALLETALSGTPDTVAWKDRMRELRDQLQSVPEDAKPATDGAVPPEDKPDTPAEPE